MQMADSWQEATSQQVKLIADRLNELLSSGLDLVHSELGVDLGLRPELYPPWVILLAACIGLVLMVALWASACRRVFKKRPIITAVDDSPPALTKTTRNDEPKKKKRKIAEKKLQANGRPAAEPQEEVPVIEEDVPHHPPAAEAKTEKAFEVKKAKKKPKQAVKEVKAATADGKEPEEGTWETKVSNKEKREQRRKDKTPGDGSGSPGGHGDPPPKHTSSEQPKATASLSAGQKKKKVESSKARAEKEDAVVTPQVDSSEAVEVSAGWTDLTVKAPANTLGPDHWTSNQSPAPGTPAPRERCSLESEGSWTVIDATEISLVEQGGSPAAVEPLPATGVEDEWSGLNGMSADPSSDWNVPSEAWVNEEESPTPEETPPPQEELPPEPAQVSDGDKDKADSPPEGNGKSKKKKKKKKKQAEDGGVTVQEGEEPEGAGEATAVVRKQPVQEAAPSGAGEEVQAPPAVTQVPQTPAEAEPTAKQNTLPAPTQTEEKPSKMVKKKKARRET